MENFSTMMFPIGNQPWVAEQPLSFSMAGLPLTWGAAIPHCIFIDLTLVIAPTYTTAPTLNGLVNALGTINVYDGAKEWLPKGINGLSLRASERMENGGIILPDPLTNGASTNPRYITRRFFWNPPTLYGQPSDGAFNCPYLSLAGFVSVTCGSLAAISADCTAATGTVYVSAGLVKYFNKLIFPPYHPRYMQTVVSGQQIAQRALYTTIGLGDSTALGAFAAGDIGTVQVETGLDTPIKATLAQNLTRGFWGDFKRGPINTVNGDPFNATYDVIPRRLNGGTPTALEVEPLDLNPVSWCPKDTRITKLPLYVPAGLTLTLSGAQTTTQAIFGRFQPLTASDRGSQLAAALAKLPGRAAVDWGGRLADDSEHYKGPLLDFLPWQARLNPMPY